MASSKARIFVESPLYQGEDERLPYRLDTTPWGGSPSNPSVAIKVNDTLLDVSTTKLAGSASVDGDYVITPLVIDLDKIKYRLEIKWESGGSTWEAWGYLTGQE
jgi:hypothetical protein